MYAVCEGMSLTGPKNMYYGVRGVLKVVRGIRTSSSLIYCKIRLVRSCIVLLYYCYYYYYYICLTAFFQDNLCKPAQERSTILDFTGARDDGVTVASAGPYANHLHLAADR